MATFYATIQDDLEAYKSLTPKVLAFLREADVSPRAAYVTRMAVEELVVNIIRHAFDGGAGTHPIQVEIQTEPGAVDVRVEDAGRPFDPRTAPRPVLGSSVIDRTVGGWGIHLVRSMSARLDYERRDGKNVVVVHVSAHP